MYTKSASCCTHGPKNLAPPGFLRGERAEKATTSRHSGATNRHFGATIRHLVGGWAGRDGISGRSGLSGNSRKSRVSGGGVVPGGLRLRFSLFNPNLTREKSVRNFLIFAWLFGMDNLLLQLTMIGLALCWQSAPSSTKRWRTDTHARGQRPAQHVPDTTNNN